MEWTDIQITVPQQYAETAEAIATMVSNGGIYIEDYRDLEQQAWEIAHVDLIEQDLLDQPRDIVKVHMYLAPDENPAEILPCSKSGWKPAAWSTSWKPAVLNRKTGRTPGRNITTPWTLASA